jgi:hypothetical protein
VSFQYTKHRIWKAEGATALLGLRLSRNQSADASGKPLGDALDGLSDVQDAPLEVYIAPTQSEDLAFAQAK